jgi:hypothetical protein
LQQLLPLGQTAMVLLQFVAVIAYFAVAAAVGAAVVVIAVAVAAAADAVVEEEEAVVEHRKSCAAVVVAAVADGWVDKFQVGQFALVVLGMSAAGSLDYPLVSKDLEMPDDNHCYLQMMAYQ